MLLFCSGFLLLSLLAQAPTAEVIEHAQAAAAAMDAGKLSVAIEEYRKVTELQPASASGFVNLGDAYFKNGDYQLAVPQLEHALQLNPSLLGAHQTLGVSLLLLGNATAAIPHLEKAPAAELLGLAYLETGRFADAIGAWQRALNDHPNDPDVLYFYSRATALASKQVLERLLAADPGSARAHQAMADHYMELGRTGDAQREYVESLRLKPYTPGVHLAFGKAMAAAGNWAGAVAEFTAESKLRPQSAETFYYLGSALLQQGQASEALNALSRSGELAPNMPGTLLAVGKAASLAGDTTRAEASLKKLLEVEKAGDLAAQAHFELAAIYQKAGKTAEADKETAEYQRLKGAGK